MTHFPGDYLALDFETSGLSPQYDHVMQIGAAVFNDGEPTGETFCERISLAGTKAKLALEAIEVQTGLDLTTPEGAQAVMAELNRMMTGKTRNQVMQEFAEWGKSVGAEKYPVVAWNAPFDHSFYAQMVFHSKKVVPKPILSPMWICAMELAKHTGRFKSHKLADVVRQLELGEQDKAHDALQDAVLAGKVYAKLVPVTWGTI